MHTDVKDKDYSSYGYAKEEYSFTATSGSVRYAAALAKKFLGVIKVCSILQHTS